MNAIDAQHEQQFKSDSFAFAHYLMDNALIMGEPRGMRNVVNAYVDALLSPLDNDKMHMLEKAYDFALCGFCTCVDCRRVIEPYLTS